MQKYFTKFKNSRILINKNFLITKVSREFLNVNIVHIIGEGTKNEEKKDEKLTAVVAPVLVMSMALTACSGSGDKEKASTTPKSGEKKAES